MDSGVTIDDVLTHFGIKGMKWGVRRPRGSDGTVEGHSSASDAEKAKDFHTRAKTHGLHTLSNQELEHLTKRMNLEQQYSRLTADQKASSKVKKGHGFVKELLGVGTTAKQTYDLVKSPMLKDLNSQLKKARQGK